MNGNGQQDQLPLSEPLRDDHFQGDEDLDAWTFVVPTSEDANLVAKMGPIGFLTTFFDAEIQPGKARTGRYLVISPEDDAGAKDAADVADDYAATGATVKLWRLEGLGTTRETLRDWCLENSFMRWLAIDEPWKRLPAVPKPPPKQAAGYRAYGNFTARITREIIRHDAGETKRHVEIQATHEDGTVLTAVVPSSDFAAMGWVDTDLGLKYAIHPGRSMKDSFQHAIRMESITKGIELRHVYTSLGWEQVDGQNVYLHAAGAIGAKPTALIDVDVPPELASLQLPQPDPGKLREAIQAVLRIAEHLGAPAAAVSAIVMALPFRAILGPARCMPHFGGTTGSYKTSTACLALRFFAPGVEYDDPMPLSWSATAAGLERLRHLARDSLLVIDNFIADGQSAQKDLQKADAVFNSQGDLTARARMRADGTTAPRMDPRGCMISTGECEPQRRSAAGRALIIQFHPGSIPLEGLKQCHQDAREGWYAAAISCYAAWLAEADRLASFRAALRELAHVQQASIQARCPGCHPRHAEAVAEWATGFELFMLFAVEAKAIEQPTADRATARVRAGLLATLAAQAEIQEELDPAEMFLEMLSSLLASQRAFLAGRDGLMPSVDFAAACGWRRVERALQNGGSVTDWDTPPGSARIGWIDSDWIYLDPTAAHAAADRMAHELGKTLGTPHQVRTRLAETGKIQVDEVEDPNADQDDRRRFAPRVRVEKSRRRALWLRHNLLFEADLDEEATDDARKLPLF